MIENMFAAQARDAYLRKAMNERIKQLAYEIELQPGEKLALPRTLVESVGAGRWIISIVPAGDGTNPVRHHGAFLNGYVADDEGLYDDCSGR
jgi:hypothetical protein